LQITNTATTPEIAFTGDTMSDFILDPDNVDVLKAKILVVEVQLFITYNCAMNLLQLQERTGENITSQFVTHKQSYCIKLNYKPS
jgi:hypothetical protein